ncbi:MAG: DegV family protein [Anaerolineae bacterium]|nr:DegV family protein [Anaerolineae bacterium]
MQIVADTGMDMYLPPEYMPEIEIHIVPHTITLMGKTYRSGLDITPEQLHPMLESASELPITSQPSAGEFAEMYRRLAATDPDILSIHMSSGLSGVVNSARAGTQMVPEANVTVIDSKTLCAAYGWQVAVAARALKAGWSKEQIIALVQRVGDASESNYTLTDLKYLIHGGRISHMKGLIASAFRIKPLIGVEKERGTYVQLGMARTLNRALQGLVNLMLKRHPSGARLRTQVLHGLCPDVAAQLHALVDAEFDCVWLPTEAMSPVLAAHTGPTMVGVAYAAESVFADVP